MQDGKKESRRDTGHVTHNSTSQLRCLSRELAFFRIHAAVVPARCSGISLHLHLCCLRICIFVAAKQNWLLHATSGRPHGLETDIGCLQNKTKLSHPRLAGEMQNKSFVYRSHSYSTSSHSTIRHSTETLKNHCSMVVRVKDCRPSATCTICAPVRYSWHEYLSWLSTRVPGSQLLLAVCELAVGIVALPRRRQQSPQGSDAALPALFCEALRRRPLQKCSASQDSSMRKALLQFP